MLMIAIIPPVIILTITHERFLEELPKPLPMRQALMETLSDSRFGDGLVRTAVV